MASRAAFAWLSVAEIARLKLPGLPFTSRGVFELATNEGWAKRTAESGSPLARPRAARGGGAEFHASVLPIEAQAILSARLLASKPEPSPVNDTTDDREAAWLWLNRQTVATKTKAQKRMAVLLDVEASIEAGATKTAAIGAAAAHHSVSPRAIINWLNLVGSTPRADWLPKLASQYKGGGKTAECDPEAYKLLASHWLRNESPAFATCYNHVLEDYARPRGITLPSPQTLRRRIDRDYPKAVKVLRREGKEAHRQMIPPQLRSVGDLHAMQAVNIDGHTCDVFVEFEDGEIMRPIMVGIQDLYSRKILAHRIGKSESTRLARLTFADMFRDWGIPRVAVLDNGRAFASKALTGGAKTRFRYVVKEFEQTGILTELGIKTSWTMPYRGSSKPIERAWRNLCSDDIARRPEVAGAYSGNKPNAKPENYRERAIPIAEFRALAASRIAAHNAREGRRTETARGQSFDAVFAASYATSVISRATDVQMQIALLEATERLCHRKHGSIELHGNRYWSPDLWEHTGQRVIVRFNPDDLHSDVHIYSKDGRYLCVAPVQERTGFFDTDGAKLSAKAAAKHRATGRTFDREAELMSAARVAALLSGHAEPPPRPIAGATRIVPMRGHVAAALKPSQQAEIKPTEPAFIDNFGAGIARLRSVD